MRSKNLIEWMTLSTNLYLLSRDKELRDSIKKLSGRLADKFDFIFTDEREAVKEEPLPNNMAHEDVKAETEMNQMMKKIFSKLRLASLIEIERLEQQLIELRKELALAEARIVALENNRKHHI
jgi:BMFP domain-containing protein YqiC